MTAFAQLTEDAEVQARARRISNIVRCCGNRRAVQKLHDRGEAKERPAVGEWCS